MMSGTTSDIGRQMVYFLLGPSTGPIITGDIKDLPPSITAVTFSNTTIFGNTRDLPRTLIRIYITGVPYAGTTITGGLNDLPPNIIYCTISGANTISGTTLDMPRTCISSNFIGNETISGDLSDLPPNTYYFVFDGPHIGHFSYSHTRSWGSPFYRAGVYYEPGNLATGLISADVDRLLIDLAALTWGGTQKQIYLSTNNSPRTLNSNAAVTALQGKGVAVYTN
jgi:hypothetical protein